jgi:catechol 2,3-dioxygenase-like lactoylglutathione lyase family enzyme
METLLFAFDQIAAGAAEIVLAGASESLTPASHRHLFASGQLCAKGDWSGVIVPGECFHLAFSAPSHETVEAFYRAALEHGGKDNGGSGSHPEHGKDYYAAFVFDPDGYRIEAVIHDAV